MRTRECLQINRTVPPSSSLKQTTTPALASAWCGRYTLPVDALRRDDIERARKQSLQEKARRALEMMRVGTQLKRAGLRSRYPRETDAQIEERLRRWLLHR
jgi:hypothetical protein